MVFLVFRSPGTVLNPTGNSPASLMMFGNSHRLSPVSIEFVNDFQSRFRIVREQLWNHFTNGNTAKFRSIWPSNSISWTLNKGEAMDKIWWSLMKSSWILSQWSFAGVSLCNCLFQYFQPWSFRPVPLGRYLLVPVFFARPAGALSFSPSLFGQAHWGVIFQPSLCGYSRWGVIFQP